MENDWKSFIVADIIRKTQRLGQEHCLGCREGHYCALIHACMTTSLLKKLECFFVSHIKSMVMDELESILTQFESRFILMATRESYIQTAQTLVDDLTPNVIYYGRFITSLNDYSICGPSFTPYINPPSEPIADLNGLQNSLQEALDDYDAVEAIADSPKKKRKTATHHDKNVKKSKSKKMKAVK